MKKIRCRCRGHGAPEIIDPCIRELVDCLNRQGVKTVTSCCGHGISQGHIGIDVKAIEGSKSKTKMLLLDIKPITHPYNEDTGRWEDETYQGKPWYPVMEDIVRGLHHKLEDVLAPEVLDEIWNKH